MAIVKMKRLHLFAMLSDRDSFIGKLQKLGCLQLKQPEVMPGDPDWAALARVNTSDTEKLRDGLFKANTALAALDKFAYQKSPLLAARPMIGSDRLFDETEAKAASEMTQVLFEYSRQITELYNQENKLVSTRNTLLPWQPLEVPLEIGPTKEVYITFGVCPAGVSADSLKQELAGQAEQAELILSSADRELNYLLLVCHRDQQEQAMSVLKTAGFSIYSVKDITGTAKQNIGRIDGELAQIRLQRDEIIQKISQYKEKRLDLKIYIDNITQEILKEETKERLLATDQTFFIDGWVPEPEIAQLEGLLSDYDCAYELSDPGTDDEVPVKLQNNAFTRPLTMVTEMYSLPAYDGIDPNPLIAPFFTIFFGIMYADIGYGLIVLIASLIISKKARPRGTVGYMMKLATLCGITTIIFGAVFGGFFGDAIPVASEAFTGNRINLPALIDPLQNPMQILILSVVIGAIHLLFGMGVKAYMCFRDGRPLEAIFDVGSWWLLFAGIAVLALGGTYWVALAGVAALVLTQGRNSPTVIGKITGGIASLYDITGYFSDVLSYTRLMALLLATSVVAQVVNILGTLSGSVVVYIIVFLIGHVFNMGINIIGTYVHSARLQYLEFFGKFYKDGGKPFNPLKIKTKYVDMIKEENQL